jgi:hypothetical protein
MAEKIGSEWEKKNRASLQQKKKLKITGTML